MQQVHPQTELLAPVGGLHRAAGYQQKAPFYFEDGLNVRPFDVIEGRGRIGSRPGSVKAYSSKLGVVGGGGTSTQIIVYPTKDVRIQSVDPATNYNGFPLACGYLASILTEYRTLLHFNLSAIPAGATIISAELLLLTAGSYAFGAASVAAWVRRLTQTGWSETLGTWNKYDGSTNWSSAGGDFTTTGQVGFSLTLLSNPGNTTITGLESLVDDAVDNRSSQLHIILMKDTVPDTGSGFNSWQRREYSDPLTTFTARLTIVYETGTGAGTPGSPIRLLDVCRSLNTPQSDSFDDEFTTGTPSVPVDLTTPWSHGAWTINGEASAGIPKSNGQQALTTNVAELRAASLADQGITTAVSREVNIQVGTSSFMQNNTAVWLFMDLNNASPNPATAGIALRAFKNSSGSKSLQLYVNTLGGTPSASYNIPGGASDTGRVRLTIDASNVIRVYWTSATVPDITFTPTGYSAAGGRVGFALDQNTAGQVCSAYDFHFAYTLAAAAVPPRTLVASAGGLLYRENTSQVISQVSSSLTLASDRRIWAQSRLQSLYIADYYKRINGTGGVTGTGGADRFDDSAISDWTTYGIDTDDDRLEIIDPADIGTASNISGFYTITSIVSTHLVISPTPAVRSNLTWRVIRAPKVYALPADTLTLIGAGTVGTSQFVHGCRSISLWADRIVLCNNELIPHGWWMSAQGYPNLWDFGDSGLVGENGLTSDNPKLTLGEAAAVNGTQSQFAGLLGDPLVTTIPITDDLLVFACRDSFYYLRGNPRAGGRMNNIPTPRGVGLISIGAWAHTPEGRLFVMTLDGLYELIVGYEGARAIPVSRNIIPEELIGLSSERYEVQLGYEVSARGLHIACYGTTGLPSIFYWYDLRSEGFFPDSRDTDHIPSAMTSHEIGDSGVATLLWGCVDGYIRKADDDADTDDGVNFDSYVDYGPIRLGAGEQGEGILHEVIDVLDENSGGVVNTIRRGHNAQAARLAEPFVSMSMVSGRNRPRYPRLRAGVAYIRTMGSGLKWARESLTITREKVGRLVTP